MHDPSCSLDPVYVPDRISGTQRCYAELRRIQGMALLLVLQPRQAAATGTLAELKRPGAAWRYVVLCQCATRWGDTEQAAKLSLVHAADTN